MRARTNFTTIQPTTGQSTQLINPQMQHLSFGHLPTDATNVVICGPNDLGITDKLNALINQYQPEMVLLPSTGSCASAITSRVPREFIQSLYNMLHVNNTSCLTETRTFLDMLISYLSNTSSNVINIPRNFWNQIGRVFSELNINESKVNMYAAVMRSMAMAISTDAQSLPTNNLLVSSLESASELASLATPAIDEDFENAFPETVLPQPDANELMTEVMNQVPTTVGEGSANPPTNLVNVNASDASENIQIHDLDDMTTVEAQAYNGMKELYSVKTLCVPISQLRIVNNGKIKVVQQAPLNYISSANLILENGIYRLETVPGVASVLSEVEIDVSMLDMNKSILDQDWVVSQIAPIRAADAPKWVSCVELSKGPEVISLNEVNRYQGINSRKEYTLIEARSLGSALSGLWSKISSAKLPTPEHIQAGASILAAGLGAAGSLFGSSGLVKASKVMASVNEGLGTLLATLSPNNGIRPEPKASIAKNALNVIPTAIEAGKSIYESGSINAQHQRIYLNGIKKAIELDYTMSSKEIVARARVRRNNNVFY